MSATWTEFANNLKDSSFLEDFLEAYIRNGYGSLPKREIDLLILRLLLEQHSKWKSTLPTAFQLARNLRISTRRVQSLLDEIAFRDEAKTDEWCRAQLSDTLKSAEVLKSGNGVQFQIDDGLVRNYAIAVIREGYGVVDTSFNVSVIKLSGEKFAALTIQLLDETDRQKILDRAKPTSPNTNGGRSETKSPLRLFVDSFARSAGDKAGELTVRLGFAAMSGGASEAITFLDSLKADPE
jgi:hypothetical protein